MLPFWSLSSACFCLFCFLFWFTVSICNCTNKTRRYRETLTQRDIERFWVYSSLSLSLRVPSFDNMRKKLDTRFPAVSLSFFFLCSLFVCVYVLLFLCLFLFNITVYFCFHGHGVFLFLLFVHLGCVSFRLFVLYVSCMK